MRPCERYSHFPVRNIYDEGRASLRAAIDYNVLLTILSTNRIIYMSIWLVLLKNTRQQEKKNISATAYGRKDVRRQNFKNIIQSHVGQRKQHRERLWFQIYKTYNVNGPYVTFDVHVLLYVVHISMFFSKTFYTHKHFLRKYIVPNMPTMSLQIRAAAASGYSKQKHCVIKELRRILQNFL